GNDLRQRGAQTLAMRRRANARLYKARRINSYDDSFPARRDLHAAGRKCRASVAGALGECRDADAKMTALGTCLGLAFAEGGHVDRLHRHFQGFFVRRLVVFEAHRRLVGKLVNEITSANVDRVEAKGSRAPLYLTAS